MSLQEIEPNVQDKEQPTDWFTIRNASIVIGAGVGIGLLTGLTFGFAAAAVTAWLMGIGATAKDSFDGIAETYNKTNVEDQRRNVYVKAMRPHDLNPACPCWDCQIEKNPKFINDPVTGKYKYWDDVPDPFVEAFKKMFTNK